MLLSSLSRSTRLAALALVALALPSATLARVQGSIVNQSFMTRPDVHGNQVVFTAEGDLWLGDLATGDARRLTSDPGVETTARFSPDGTMIAFNAGYDGGNDVYVMPTEGGIPKRLTFDTGSPVVQGWTPDGKSVLFRTNSKLYSSSVEQFATAQLFTVPIIGGLPKLVPVPRGSFASLNHDGVRLAYVPTSNEWMHWFRYEAGEADKVWLANLATGKFTQLTNSNDVDTQPVWAGDDIYFVSERSGVRNLWKLNPNTKQVKQLTFSTDVPVRSPSSDGHKVVYEIGPVLGIYDPATGKSSDLRVALHSDHLHMRPYEAPVGMADGATLGPNAKRVAITSQGQLVSVAAEEGSLRNLIADSGQRVQNPAWSPDGKQIAYVSDASGEEQVWLLGTAQDSTPKQLTTNLMGENGRIKWAPNSTSLLIGNRAGDTKLVDATTGAIKLVNHSQGPLEEDQIQTDFTFSPDSKWIAFSTSLGTRESVTELYDVAGGKTTLVSDPTIDSASPAFSTDGKFLYFVQNRSLSMSGGGSGRIAHVYKAQVTAIALAADTPSPFLPKDEDEAEAAKKPEGPKPGGPPVPVETKVDLAGISDRFFDMKVPAGEYDEIWSLPGKLIISSSAGVQSFDIEKKVLTMVAPGVRVLDTTPDHKKFLVSAGPNLQVIEVGGPPGAPGAGMVKLAGLTITVDPARQWHQILEEAWRVARDFYYDPNMMGANWAQIRKKYEAQLPMAGSRDDLTRIIGDMIAELNTGHCYTRGPSAYARRVGRQGLLGVDLVWDSGASAYRISHMLKPDTWNPDARSPFAEVGAGVHEGDYLLKIRGQKLQQGEDPAALLIGTAGQTVTVTVNSTPSLTGARTIAVEPIASESALRLHDWIESRRAYVTKASGGKLGYVYVGDMSATGANQFASQYYPLVDKPGIIVDVRGNGGGSISGNLLSDLSTKITGFFSFRAGGMFRREGWAPLGHVVALTDEFAFSDGEYFSEFFKRLKIGPLIGHRTGGGEVGSGGGYRFVDGGTINIPNYGAWIPGEWVVEGRGAVPDIEVDQDPVAEMAGKDPQLDKAISVALDELRAQPVSLPQHPPYPVKVHGSRGG